MSVSQPFEFDAPLWEWESQASWFFVSLPEELTDEIDDRFSHRAAGFGSIRVEATVGATTWRTSVFPDVKRGTLILPVKKDVRRRESLSVGQTARFSLCVVTD